MFRENQIIDNFIYDFIKEKGVSPSQEDIDKFISKTLLYSPATKPMVPLKGATSIAPYISDTLKDLLLDRSHLSELVTNLYTKTERSINSTKHEVQFIDDKVTSILNSYKDNSFKTLYNEVPELFDAGNTEDIFLWAASASDLYLIDDDSEIQNVTITAHNVKKSPEGISLVKSSEEEIKTVFSTKLYSTSQAGTTMQIINEVNPISILVNGTKGNDKGIDLTLKVTEKFVSEIELDVNPLNITVFLDGVELFTKSLDGPSIVSLNKLVSNEIVLRLYGDAAQVYINIENLKVISSKYSVTGSFGKGTYAAIDLDIDTSYGNIIFKPDQFIPTGTSIAWEYSSDTIDWSPVELAEDGSYTPLLWNAVDKVYEPDSVNINNDIIKFVPALPYENPKDVKVSVGKDSLMFVTKELVGYYAFAGYITALDESGYTLSLFNPIINSDGNFLFSRISIISDDFSFDEIPKEEILVDIPFGTHKLSLELTQTSRFDLDYNVEKDSEGDPVKRTTYENIINIIRTEYLIDLTLEFPTDTRGRDLQPSIQPYNLTEVDNNLFNYIDEKTMINSFSIDTDSYINLKQLKNSSKYYDVLMLGSTYSHDLETNIPAELHYYTGDGSADHTFELYYLPYESSLTVYAHETYATFLAGDAPIDITSQVIEDGQNITVPSLSIPDTTDSKSLVFEYSGESSFTTIDLLQEPLALPELTGYNFNEGEGAFLDDMDIVGEGNIKFIYYEQLIVKLDDLEVETYVDLSREALASSNFQIIDYPYVDGTTGNRQVALTADTVKVDLSNTGCNESIIGHTTAALCNDGAAAHADNLTGHWIYTPDSTVIWGKYTVVPTLSLTEGTKLMFSNIPDVSVLHDKLVQEEEASSIQMTDVAALHLERAVTEPRHSDVIVKVTDQETSEEQIIDGAGNFTGTEICDEEIEGHTTNALCDTGAAEHSDGLTGHWGPSIKIISIAGNIITMDLSYYYSIVTSQLYTIEIIYNSLSRDRKIQLQYDYEYYANIPFKFAYNYLDEIRAQVEDIYSDSTMLQHFYDISYYITSNEDDPAKDIIKLHLMASLQGNKTSSPIIRRLIFERQ